MEQDAALKSSGGIKEERRGNHSQVGSVRSVETCLASDTFDISNIIRTYRALIRLCCENVRFRSAGFPNWFGQVCRSYSSGELEKGRHRIIS